MISVQTGGNFSLSIIPEVVSTLAEVNLEANSTMTLQLYWVQLECILLIICKLIFLFLKSTYVKCVSAGWVPSGIIHYNYLCKYFVIILKTNINIIVIISRKNWKIFLSNAVNCALVWASNFSHLKWLLSATAAFCVLFIKFQGK